MRSRVSNPSKWKQHSSTILRASSVLFALSLVTFGPSLTAASASSTTTWAAPTEIPGTSGTGGIGDNGNVTVAALSCAPDGGCSAGGSYEDADGNTQAFVVNETSSVWGTPIELSATSGEGYLGSGGYAEVASLSCSSAGNCAAGGSYEDANGNTQAFVVNEVNGTWGTPIELGAIGGADGFLGDSDYAYVQSVSCSSAGNCSAGGYYYAASDGYTHAFVVNETDGTWGSPMELSAVGGGDGVLGDTGTAYITSLSCASDTNCTGGGFYYDGEFTQAFVVDEVSGTWGTPTEVGPITNSDYARVNAVSCSSAGNCTAGGYYNDGAYDQAFVINEVAGVWGSPASLAPVGGGEGYLGDDGGAQVTSLSCASDGNCSAGGFYNDYGDVNVEQAFVVNETGGTWGDPTELAATSGSTGNLGDNGFAQVTSLACSSTGNCSASGSYYDGDNTQAFVVNEVSGTWGTPLEISGLSGTGGLGDDGVNAIAQALSCSTDGYCALGGSYDIDEGDEAFISATVTTTTYTPPPPVATTTTTTTVPPTTTTTTTPVVTRRPSGLPVYVYFANDKAVLSAHDKRVLNTLSASLKASDTTHVSITGYANYLGTNKINLPLSMRRADVTRNYLDKALANRGDTGVSFSVRGAGVLRAYSPISLDRVAIVSR